MANMEQKNDIQELKSIFDGIRHQSDDGREYWSSRELSDAFGYSGYWKFKTVIERAISVANKKGMKIDDHFNLSVDMVRLGSGAFRKVETFHLSRLACLIVAENADEKKAYGAAGKTILLRHCFTYGTCLQFNEFQYFILQDSAR